MWGADEQRIIEKVCAGECMPAPDGTPPCVAQLLVTCWAFRPDDRPDFDVLVFAVREARQSIPP